MSPRRHALTVPALAVLLAALTACGGGAAGEPAAEPTSTSSDAVPSPTPSAAPTLSKEEFVRTIVDAQVAAGSYDLEMVMESAGETMRMTGSMHLGDVPSLAMSMELPGEAPTQLLSTGGIWYISLGEMTGGKFLEIDPADTSNPFASEFEDVLTQMDPSVGLKAQEAAIVSVTPQGGPTEVDGVEVQRYVVVVDPSKAPEQLAELEAQLPAGASVPETLEYQYLVDTEGRAREMSFDLMGIRSSLYMTNWGAATPVVAPTADQITTLDALGS